MELKEPDSKETMLRCVLEGYTYLKKVNQTKLLADFGLPVDTKVTACPFVFREGFQWKEMQQNRPWLKCLIEHLNIKVYYINQENNNYIVEKKTNSKQKQDVISEIKKIEEDMSEIKGKINSIQFKISELE